MKYNLGFYNPGLRITGKTPAKEFLYHSGILEKDRQQRQQAAMMRQADPKIKNVRFL